LARQIRICRACIHCDRCVCWLGDWVIVDRQKWVQAEVAAHEHREDIHLIDHRVCVAGDHLKRCNLAEKPAKTEVEREVAQVVERVRLSECV
jgi:hypothetical protein